MNTVFLLCGQTACGKDSIARKIEDRGYKVLKSYATRPKRVNEGDTHIFISAEEVDIYRRQMVAYTMIGEYEYFSTKEQLEDCDIYIIDYEGIKFLKEKVKDVRFVTIFINVSEDERWYRIGRRHDDLEAAHKRNIAENDQFNELKQNADFDYSVCNMDLEKASDIVEYIIKRELIDEA